METKDQIDSLIKKIKNAHQQGKFPSYIEDLRFQYFKNISSESKIIFEFPLTVFTGINGSGKSSALHALYGCPDRYSTGDYWFSTPLDPIQERNKGEIPSFIYTYKEKNRLLEVIKRRSGVSKGLDYWETSRPIKLYGMKLLENNKRNPPIKKKVIFLDFRSELSAFDKFFHFGHFSKRKTITSKQDFIRRYSKYINNSYKEDKQITIYNKSSQKPQIVFDKSLKIISDILGKSYEYCKILFHNFYGDDGATVLFKYNNIKYSEAFAGRGEFAIVKLVYEIENTEEGALLILDEPEVSLHPLAQEKLKIYLLKSCLEKKIQIVISTHSSKIIEFLPNNAIKLFYEDDKATFSILNECTYFEAFNKIGETINNIHKKTIIVEDKTAKILIDNIIDELGGEYPLIFNVIYFSGGAEHALKSSVLYSQENELRKYVLLDGDKRRPHFNPDAFSIADSEDIEFLETKLKESTNSDIKSLGFRIDGNSAGGNLQQKKEAILSFLKYQYTNINYLPLNIPEEFLWDDDTAKSLITTMGVGLQEFSIDYKSKFKELSMILFNESSADYIEKTQIILIKKFVTNKNQNYEEIVSIIKKFNSD